MSYLLELDGELLTVPKYCERLGYSYSAILSLRNRHKLTWEDAIDKYIKKNEDMLIINEKAVSLAEYCKLNDYSYGAIVQMKRRYNLNNEEAIVRYINNKNKRVSKDRRLRHIWYGMMDRCYNPKNHAYKWYGKKGIRVCERWHDYFNFEDDMYESYIKHCEDFGIKNTSIDRYPNKQGNYEMLNVRWATQKEQMNNILNNFIVIDNLTLSQFCEKYNLSPSTTYQRLYKGWSVEKIIATPTRKVSKTIILPTGETISEFCANNNISKETFMSRLARGWSLEKIMNTPINHDIILPNGKTIRQLSEETGIPKSVIYKRYKKGWSINKIIDTPVKKLIILPTGERLSEFSKRVGIPKRTLHNKLERGWTLEQLIAEYDKDKEK